MEDKAVLMYVKDDVVYPVALSNEQVDMLQFFAQAFAPLKVIRDHPLGKAVNLTGRKDDHE